LRLPFGRRFVRTRDGTYAVRLDDDERQLLRVLTGHLASRVETEPDDPWLQRLFPTAYPKDPEREEEWRLLMSLDLHDRRRAQLRTLGEGAAATRVSEEELLVWTQALNDLRLYLGTRLDIDEETEMEDLASDDDRQLFALYMLLGVFQEDTVQALSEGLPDVGQEDSAG
jgi:hypothetical protein